MTEESQPAKVLIATQTKGFYAGFNPWVAAVPKVIIAALLIWVASSPAAAGAQLLALQSAPSAQEGSTKKAPAPLDALGALLALTQTLVPPSAPTARRVNLGTSWPRPSVSYAQPGRSLFPME